MRCLLRSQSPLQPLQDNLESTTYETFERDSQKYSVYQLAIAAALTDRVSDAHATSTEARMFWRQHSFLGVL